MRVPFGFVSREIYAGPYRDKPKGVFGVKLAQEIPAPSNIAIPIRDFGVPTDSVALQEALREVIKRLARHESIYVGCMGGKGRTGLFLALLVKALGKSNPVQYVRANYDPHAVETPEQERYVAQFDVTALGFDSFLAGGTAFYTDVFRFFTGKSNI
jgi:hypothetical protein